LLFSLTSPISRFSTTSNTILFCLSSNDDNPDEQKHLRSAIYGILKYYVQRHLRIDELNALLSSIATLSTASDSITRELLEFILALIDPPSISTDTTVGLLCEPLTSESLYALLTINSLSCETKELVMKIIKCLVNSRRVPQQIRAQLRLETNHIGFGGIISGLTPNELNVSIVRDILHLILQSDSNMAVDHLNVVLTLCSAASLDVRYVAMRKLMSCFIANPAFCRAYSKCHGWQETLTHFFVKSRSTTSLSGTSDGLLIGTKDQSVDSGHGSSNGTSIEQHAHAVGMTVSAAATAAAPPSLPQLFETSSSPDDPKQERLVRQLDLSPITDGNSPTDQRQHDLLTSNALLTPTSLLNDSKDPTPEFLRRTSNEFHADMNTPLRSTSASREDLLSLVKTEASNDDLMSITSSNEPRSPSPGMARTSMIQFSNRQRQNSAYRQWINTCRQTIG
jgi:hypothetical protein